jgi:hypothetical protein
MGQKSGWNREKRVSEKKAKGGKRAQNALKVQSFCGPEKGCNALRYI